MIIPVCFAIAAGLSAVTLALVIVVMINGDGVDSAAGQWADITRLTAPLPEREGRHRPEYVEAIGTEAQRRLGDTIAIDLGEVARAVAAR